MCSCAPVTGGGARIPKRPKIQKKTEKDAGRPLKSTSGPVLSAFHTNFFSLVQPWQREPLRIRCFPSNRFSLFWKILGGSLEGSWPVYGRSMDSLWTICGLSMDCLRTVYGWSLDDLWIIYGLSVDCPWNVYGLFMDSLWTVFE